VVVWGVSVGLAIHAALATTVGTKAALAVAGIVLVIVRVAVVGVVVARILLTVRLGLAARTGLLLRLLSLVRGVRGVAAAVLRISSARSETGLLHATLGVLAEVIVLLGSIVSTEAALLRGSTVGLALAALLLSVLLTVVVAVRVAVVLTGGVVGRVLARSRAEGPTGLLRLRLRGRSREVVEGGLSGRSLLREGILRLGCGGILDSGLSIATKLCV
jgi:hypothetical protein